MKRQKRRSPSRAVASATSSSPLDSFPRWTGPRCCASTACSERRVRRTSSRGNGSSTRPADWNGSRHGILPNSTPAAWARSYRLDFWNDQPARVEVWSEKGTIRGVLQPVLDEYGVGFRVMHGFASATAVYDVAQDDDGRPLVVLYVGDYDPSGMYMSERDLPDRLEKYDGGHVELRRIALKREHTSGLLSFPATEKKKDKRYKWFVQNYGKRCWELDALDPNALRSLVEAEIASEIEPEAWARCTTINEAQRESIRDVLGRWKDAKRLK